MEWRGGRVRAEPTGTAAQSGCCLGGGVRVPKYGSSTAEGRRWVRENIPDGVLGSESLGG